MIARLLTFLLLIYSVSLLHGQEVIVLGIAQDGGYPQIACQKSCCKEVWNKIKKRNYVSSIALIDHTAKEWYLFDATPDLPEQLQLMSTITMGALPYLPKAIFITHAHMGHYTGLMYLGREALGAKSISVYCPPRLSQFLVGNGPWSQLVSLNNIILMPLSSEVDLSNGIKIKHELVPHRDEYSETVAYYIHTAKKKYIYLPDIDKWHKWSTNIVDLVSHYDIAFLDATFNDASELAFRNIGEVPHPFVSETSKLFDATSVLQRSKIHFIHLNHTNELLRDKSLIKQLKTKGYRIAEQGRRY